MKGRHTVWLIPVYLIWAYYNYLFIQKGNEASGPECMSVMFFVIATCGVIAYWYIETYSKTDHSIIKLLDKYFTIKL